jgi:cold shock CspA family protein
MHFYAKLSHSAANIAEAFFRKKTEEQRMNVPNGVQIALFNLRYEGELPVVDEGYDKGFIGDAESLRLEYYLDDDEDEEKRTRKFASLLIEIVVAKGHKIYGFTVNGNKDVVPSKNWRDAPADDEDQVKFFPKDTRVYRCTVPIRYSENRDELTTKYPHNNKRLLEALGNGWFQLWSISIIAQDGDFFLTCEKSYEPFRCYRSGSSLICPFFLKDEEKNVKGWPPLITLIKRLLKSEDFEALPTSKAAEKDPPLHQQKKVNGIQDGEGIVDWFSSDMQIGALRTTQGVVRVHWSNVVRNDFRRKFLQDGERVIFTELTPPAQTKERPTGFKLEAIGVQLK